MVIGGTMLARRRHHPADVARRVALALTCWSGVTRPSPTSPTKRLNQSTWTRMHGPKKLCIRWSRIPQEKGALLGGADISEPIVEYKHLKHLAYPACGRYSQLYSVDGSGDAAFHCHYCSNLLLSIIHTASKTSPRLTCVSAFSRNRDVSIT